MTSAGTTATDLFRTWFEHSPFTQRLGLRIERIDTDVAELLLPQDGGNATFADVVHGGAIATLIDVAAAAASWSGADVPENPRGATVDLSVQYLAAGRGELRAQGRVLRRGTLCRCAVDVTSDDGLVAHALVTYKVG